VAFGHLVQLVAFGHLARLVAFGHLDKHRSAGAMLLLTHLVFPHFYFPHIWFPTPPEVSAHFGVVGSKTSFTDIWTRW
jgi:hypothetical protein